MFYIYSLEHNAWWGPDSFGYTKFLREAGLYDKAEATRILINANAFDDEPQEIMVHEESIF